MAESDSNVINQQDKNATMSYIVCNAQNVSISMKGIQQLTLEVMTYMLHNITIDNIGEIGFKYARLSSEFHPTQNDCRAVDWLFVLNTLNFALWPKKNEPEWSVNGLTGYMALCAAIKRAIDVNTFT
ncbi:PREDICTED: UPF0553 protein v1g230591-like [Vollenhovia emeryi]|uniref:UPF0553 protein v1g230591-like n=1 Tax=Vollenhovia emeryi TaxID=411798 RepID=UPI0005F530FA|nr:PREDICTED: UPF0553 protein v1g230591-like [Vollenhovia emeryi]